MGEKEFTDDEKKRLREILDQDEKWRWFYAISRRFGAWVFGVTAALVAFRDDVKNLIYWMTGG